MNPLGTGIPDFEEEEAYRSYSLFRDLRIAHDKVLASLDAYNASPSPAGEKDVLRDLEQYKAALNAVQSLRRPVLTEEETRSVLVARATAFSIKNSARRKQFETLLAIIDRITA